MFGNFIDEECIRLSPGLAGANRLDNNLYALAPITERKIALFLSSSVIPLATNTCPNRSTYNGHSS